MKQIALILFFTSLILCPFQDFGQSGKINEKVAKISENEIRMQSDIPEMPRGIIIQDYKENGIALSYLLPNKSKVFINRYDKNFNKIFSVSADVEENMKLYKVITADSSMYLLITDSIWGYKRRTKKTIVLQLDLRTRKISKLESLDSKKLEVRDFISFKDGSIVVLENKHKIFFHLFDFRSKTFEARKFESPKSATYLCSTIDENLKKLTLYIKINDQPKANSIYAYEYACGSNNILEPSSSTQIQGMSDRDVYSCIVTQNNAGEKLMAGVFCKMGKLSKQYEKYQQGLFLTKLQSNTFTDTRFIYLKDIENLNTNASYDKLKTTPNEPPSYDPEYKYFLPTGIIETEDEYIFSTECYAAQILYSSSTSTTTDIKTGIRSKKVETLSSRSGFFPLKFIIMGFSKQNNNSWCTTQDLYTDICYDWDLPEAQYKAKILNSEIYYTLGLGSILYGNKLNDKNEFKDIDEMAVVSRFPGDSIYKSRNKMYESSMHENYYLVYGWEYLSKNPSKENPKTNLVISVNKRFVKPK